MRCSPMPRFRMQRLLQVGLLIGVSTSLVYFYFIYSLPAEDDSIQIDVRIDDEAFEAPPVVKIEQQPHKTRSDNTGNKVTAGAPVKNERYRIHSNSKDGEEFAYIPETKLKFEGANKVGEDGMKRLDDAKAAVKNVEKTTQKLEETREPQKQHEKSPERSPEQEEVTEEVVEYADSPKERSAGVEGLGKEVNSQKEQHDKEEDAARQFEMENGMKKEKSKEQEKDDRLIREDKKTTENNTKDKKSNRENVDANIAQEKHTAAQAKEQGLPRDVSKKDEVKEPAQEVVPAEVQGKNCGEHCTEKKKPSKMEPMHLAVVACGERVDDTLVMIKSACIVSEKKIHVHIFADDDNRPKFQKELSSWKFVTNGKLQFTIHPITFPRGDSQEWIKLFRPCATQRLFLPEVLPDIELILYVDTDILFLQSMDAIWRFFDDFNATHIAALAPEHEDPHVGWYNRFARHPYYPPLGLNSGVMLMNLSRMREVKFVDHMPPYLKKYKYSITWGDQDLINIYFHFYPEKLLPYPCQWNYRPDHCMYMSVCKTAEQDGAQVLHGCRESFKNDKQPMFKAIFQAFDSHNVDDGIRALIDSFKSKMEKAKETNCGRVAHIFTKVLEKMAARS